MSAIEFPTQPEGMPYPLCGMNSYNKAVELRKARLVIREAEKALDAWMEAMYPVDSEIEWKRGNYIQKGVVILLSSGGRLKVENIKTGKEVWITSFDVEMARLEYQ